MKVAVSNFSFGSCKDIVPIFKTMFDNHPVVSGMQLSDRKVSYVLSHELGPYFHRAAVSDLKVCLNTGGYFSLAFDETTSCQVKKQLDIYVRFWSIKENMIVSSCLTSHFLGHANAETLCSSILKTLDDDKLALKKLLMLSMDGPNVNLLTAKKLNEELLKIGSPKLVDVNTCTLHKVHNCFSKSLDVLPFDIDEFAVDLFSFFKYSAARREDLKKLQVLLECEQKFLLRHVNSRWLTLGTVVSRILCIYPVLKEYFLTFLPKQKSSWSYVHQNSRYKRIVTALQDPKTVVFLEFVSALIPNLQEYLTLFQTEGPLIHLLYSKMSELFRSILLKFIKEECVGRLEEKQLLCLDITDFQNYCSLKDLDIGVGAKRALSKLKESETKNVRMSIRSSLIKLAQNLRDSLPFSNELLKDLGILHPHMRKKKSDSAIHRLCVAITPLNMTDQDINRVISEWQAYRLDAEVDKLCESCEIGSTMHIDLFWRDVFGLKDMHSSKQKYSNLEILVKSCLSLSHGNADVERGFSLNNDIVLENRWNLSESVIIAIRHVKDVARKCGGILSIPVTGKLLDSVRKSHSAYVASKEAEKRASEEQKKKRACEEEEQLKLSQLKKQKTEKDENINKINNNISRLQEELDSANNCLSEANNKLETAIRYKDFNSMRTTTIIIDGATHKIQELTKQLSSAQEKLRKIIK